MWIWTYLHTNKKNRYIPSSVQFTLKPPLPVLSPDGVDSYQVRREQPLVVVPDGGGGGEEPPEKGTAKGEAVGTGAGVAPSVDHTYNLHVTTQYEGLWACMAANEVI